MIKLPTFERNLAITDVETTGVDSDRHEILEIGLLVVRQGDLKIIDELDVKVKPEHIETAEAVALHVNGYREEDWKDAITLADAMEQYQEKVGEAIFLAHPLAFDLGFIERAFKKTGRENPMDYHQLDLFSMAWAILNKDGRLSKVTLFEMAKYFGLEPEPKPHRAIHGARIAYEILKKLLELSQEKPQGKMF